MARILVIDDENELRTLLIRIFTHRGHETVAAANGREALRQLELAPGFDVIVTDLFMPEMDGIETLRHIKTEWPDGKVIVISGGGNHTGLDMLPMAEKLGADRTFAKPFDPAELAAAVEELIYFNMLTDNLA